MPKSLLTNWLVNKTTLAATVAGLALFSASPTMASGPDFELGIDASVGGQTNFQPFPTTVDNRALPNDIVVRVYTGGFLQFPDDYTVSLTIDGKIYNAVAFDPDLIPPINRLVQNDRDFSDDYDEFRFLWRGYSHGFSNFEAQTLFVGAQTPPASISAQVTIPDSVAGPSLTIHQPTPGTDVSGTTELQVEAETDLTALSVQAFITIRNQVTTVGTVNLAQASIVPFKKPIGNFSINDTVNGLNLENGTYPIQVIAATGLNGTGIRTVANTSVVVSGLPTPPSPPTYTTNGGIEEYLGLPPLAVSSVGVITRGPITDGSPVRDFGQEGTLTELHGRVSADGMLHFAIRGEFFNGGDPTANALILLLDTDAFGNTGAQQFLTGSSDIVDPSTNSLVTRLRESNFVIADTLRGQGMGFDAALVVDRVDPVGASLFAFGTGTVTTGSLDNLVSVPVQVAYSRGQDVFPGAPGTNLTGPTVMEVAIPLSSLGNPNARNLRLAAVFTSDAGLPSPNTLPENSSTTFDSFQILEDLALFPDSPVVRLIRVSNGDRDFVEVINLSDGVRDMTSWSLRWADANGLSAYLPLGGLTLAETERRILEEGTSRIGTNFDLGFNIPWENARAGTAAIIDPYGLGVDYVRWEGSVEETRQFADPIPSGTQFFNWVPSFGFDTGVLDLVQIITRDEDYTDTDHETDWTDFTLFLDGVSLEVRGSNDAGIVNGDITPDSFDGTQFPDTPVNGTSDVRTFRVINNGLVNVVLDNVVLEGDHAGDFVLLNTVDGLLSTGQSQSFDIQFVPSDLGERRATVRIFSSDESGVPGTDYVFSIAGNGVGNGVLTVFSEDGSVEIVDGDQTPSGTDGTDFGVLSSLNPVTRTFQVSNTGGFPITIGSGSAPAVQISGPAFDRFEVLNQPPDVIQPGESFPVTIQFNPDADGVYSAEFQIPFYDDGYNFNLEATVELPLATEGIVVLGAGQLISAGDLSPSTVDGTDFGRCVVNRPTSAFIDRTYVLQNIEEDIDTGGGLSADAPALPVPDTTLSGITITGTHANDFTVTRSPATVIPTRQSDFLTIRFTPTGTGLRTALVTINSNDGSNPRYSFAIQGTGVNNPGGFVLQVSNTFPTWSGWTALGQTGELFKENIGYRCFIREEAAIGTVIQPSPRSRVFGWIEEPNNDVPYSSVGPDQFLRAKFAMYYEGPGDSASATLSNRVPNFRMSMRTKGVLTTQLEVNHNSHSGGNAAHAAVTRELGPSKNADAPSIYRLDFDPADVPYLQSNPSEGIQRAFEVVVSGAEFAYISGTLFLTESTLGVYPVLDPAVNPIKVFAAGGSPGLSDFDNSSVVVSRLGVSTSEIYRYLLGPNQADYFNSGILAFSFNESGLQVTKSPEGITVNSVGYPTSRIGIADAAFGSGVFGDTNQTRLRIEPGKLYQVTYRLRHDGASNTTPFTRLNARTVGFGWNVSLEMLGARGLPAGPARTFLNEVLPGTGNQISNTTADGTSYRLLLHSPLALDVRADRTGTLAERMPNLSAQPGTGNPASSLRDINFGFTVADSLSLVSTTATDANEAANNLTLNLIEVREYPQVAD